MLLTEVSEICAATAYAMFWGQRQVERAVLACYTASCVCLSLLSRAPSSLDHSLFGVSQQFSWDFLFCAAFPHSSSELWIHNWNRYKSQTHVLHTIMAPLLPMRSQWKGRQSTRGLRGQRKVTFSLIRWPFVMIAAPFSLFMLFLTDKETGSLVTVDSWRS